jgi:site-specific DNA recombinase
MISERTRDKIAATRRKGKWSGGMPLLGYDVDPHGSKLIVNNDEAAQVRAIFQLYLDHEGLVPAVEELGRRGWRNKRWLTRKGTLRGGRFFDKNSLWHLLTNVTYTGKVKYKTEVHKGEHEAIVSDETWQKVQSILQRNGRTGGGIVRNKFGAILKSLLHCVPCDCVMTPTHTTRNKVKRYRYYVCTGAQKRGRQSCPSGPVPAGEIEQFIVDQIRRIGRDPQLVAETLRQTRGQTTQRATELADEKQRLDKQLIEHYSELQKVVTRSSDTSDDGLATTRLANIQERIVHVERRLTEVRNEIEYLRRDTIDEGDVARALATFDPVWESLTTHEQARLLRLLIERIDYDGRDGTISISFHASGIKTLANREPQGGAA